MKQKTLILAIILIILPMATALIEDFSAYAEHKEVSICQCSTAAEQITITNTAPITSLYTITTEGAGSEYIQTIPDKLTLESGQTGQVFNIITATCNVKGDKELTTYISTTTGTTKKIEQKITFKECDNTQVEIFNENSTITTCPSEQKEFKIKITNTGTFKEEYEIKTDKYADWMTTDNETIKIEAGQSKTATLYFKSPEDKFGTYNFNAYVKAINNHQEIQVPLTAQVDACYWFQLTAEQPRYEICDAEETRIPVLLKNTAEVANNYEITYNGPAWTKIDAKEAKVEAGKDVTLGIIVKPAEHFEGGDYFATIKAKEKISGQEQNITIPLYVNECYELAIKANKQDSICQGETIIYPITIENKGSYSQLVNVHAEGIMEAWTTTYIKANNESTAEFVLEVPADKLSGKLYFTATIDGRNESAKAQTYLNVLTQEKCYKPSIELEKTIQAGTESERTIPLIVKNTGIRTATYIVTLDAPEWIQADKTRLTLAAGEEDVVYLTATPTTEVEDGDYEATLGLVKDNIMYTKTIPITVKGEQTEVKENKFVNFLKNYIYYIIAGIAILIILLVVLKIFSDK
jgi:uncharacterized membrane protein